MMCYENSEEEKYENGGEENKQESKNPEEDERKARNTEETQGIPLTQSYICNVFMTGITNEWVMSTIVDNLATPRVTSSVRAWIEYSKHGEDEKSRNTFNVLLAREKSMIKHRSSNV